MVHLFKKERKVIVTILSENDQDGFQIERGWAKVKEDKNVRQV